MARDFRRKVFSDVIAVLGMWTAWLVLIISLCLTAWAWRSVKTEVEQDARRAFDSRVQDITYFIRVRLKNYEALLRGGTALFAVSPTITRDQWHDYVHSMSLEQDFPGVFRLNFAKRISSAEKNALVQQIRAEGFPDFTLWPTARRAEYAVNIYVEPLTEKNRRVLGFDHLSAPERRIAMEQARDTGKPVVSGKTSLLENEKKGFTGFVMYAPVYRKGLPAETVEQRRAALIGYVASPILGSDLVQDFLGAGNSDIDLGIFDGAEISAATLLYENETGERHDREHHPSAFSSTVSINAGGHPWTLFFSSRPAFEATIDNAKPRLVLLAGTLISLLFFAIAWSLVSRRLSVLAVNEKLQAEIVERKREKELLHGIALTLSSVTGEAFFRELALNLARGLGMDYAFVGEVDPNQPDTVHTLAFCNAGQMVANIDYHLTHDTPCGSVECKSVCYFPENAQKLFPEDDLIHRYGVETFIGHPLVDSVGRVLGLLVVMHEKPIADKGYAQSLLQICASRAAAELERRQTEAQMRQLSSAVEQTADVVVITDRHGAIQYVNSAYEQITGYSRQEVLGRNASVVKSGEHDKAFYEEMWRTILAGKGFRRVLANRKKDGSLYYEEKTITPLKDVGGNIVSFVSTGKDISDRRQAEERLHHLAHHDPLTDLPNRLLLQDRLKQAMLEAGRLDRLVAVMFLDLDRFKTINDTLGHDTGDAMLKAVAERLATCLRPGDTASRLGGDEFTIILANVAHVDDVTRVAQKILDQFISPFRIGGRDLFVTPSIGITLYPLDEKEPENLFKDADVAMYRAKELGGNTFQFYTPELNARAARRLELETGLRQALERQEFVLHYQPLVDMKTGRVRGMEALLRWQHPEFGLIPPLDFIPLAEETGLIIPIGEWVLKTACAQIKAWHDTGFPALHVAVNLSSKQLRDKNLIDIVKQALQEAGIEARYLDLELTESVLMQDMELAVAILKELKRTGVSFSLDDFGTGYSSLSYLKRFPIDYLKIDRSFVRDITTDPFGAVIVRAIIAMAHTLNIKVIAEGVETHEQLALLRKEDCDMTQGYYCSEPLSVETFTELLRDWDRLRAGKCSIRN